MKSEGFARDLVRLIQNIRRDTKLEVTDKVNVEIFCSKKLKESFLNHYEYISEQTLSHSLNIQEEIKDHGNLFSGKISGEEINLSVLKNN